MKPSTRSLLVTGPVDSVRSDGPRPSYTPLPPPRKGASTLISATDNLQDTTTSWLGPNRAIGPIIVSRVSHLKPGPLSPVALHPGHLQPHDNDACCYYAGDKPPRAPHSDNLTPPRNAPGAEIFCRFGRSSLALHGLPRAQVGSALNGHGLRLIRCGEAFPKRKGICESRWDTMLPVRRVMAV